MSENSLPPLDKKDLVYELKCASDWLDAYAENRKYNEYLKDISEYIQEAVKTIERPDRSFFNLLALAADASRTGNTERIKQAVCEWVASGSITIKKEESDSLRNTGIRFTVDYGD